DRPADPAAWRSRRSQHRLRPERRRQRRGTARAGSVAAGDDRAATAPERRQPRHREAGPGTRVRGCRSRAALPRARSRLERPLVQVIEPNLAGATAIAEHWYELLTSASTPA